MSELTKRKQITFSPTIAAHFGIYEAIILQLLAWVDSKEQAGVVLPDGYRYCYNTYQDWHKMYPFISERTIQRTIANMEEIGLIVSCQPDGYNRQKYYRISQAILARDKAGEFDNPPICQNGELVPSCQVGEMEDAKLARCTIVHKSHISFPELKNSGQEPDFLSLSSEPVGKPKRGRPPKPSDPRHQEAIAMFCEMYEERFDRKYDFKPSDAKHLKEFLRRNQLVTVSEMRETLSNIWTYEVTKGEFVANRYRIHNLTSLVLRWNDIIAILT